MNSPQSVPLREALRVWCRIAALSFGGPAGQIAVMQRILVDEKRWISQERFHHALSYCMLLPGPEAQQLATYSGWLLHGTFGGLLAGSLFVLPGFLSILLLSFLYASYQQLPLVAGLFFGLKPAVLAIVLEALVRVGRRALVSRLSIIIALLAFVGIFFLRVPFPLIIIAAGLFGYLGALVWPDVFAPPSKPAANPQSSDLPHLLDHAAASAAKPTLLRTLSTALLWLALWFLPVLIIITSLGPGSIFSHQALFFSKSAAVTFGGAYSVLSYVKDQAVAKFGWLSAGEMLDGLGMAETTPGPLIQIVQFVAYLGAFRSPQPFSPFAAGLLASVITTWVTFVPSFLYIFTGAPYVEYLRNRKTLNAALRAITAAVFGVILNLSIWFALRIIFTQVHEPLWHGIRLQSPAWHTFQPLTAAMSAAALIALFRFHLGLFPLLASSALTGLLLRLANLA